MAGPNGVGKTRTLSALLQRFQKPRKDNGVRVRLTATSTFERDQWGGLECLDTSDPKHTDVLERFLRRPHKRGELRGGVLNFDASRSFEAIQPYAWSWDFQDPFEESIDWSQTYQPVRNRFQDVIHSLLRKVRSHKESISDKALSLMAAGETNMALAFSDPLEKFKNAFARLLPGKKLVTIDQKSQAVQFETGGTSLPLADLSSGEREVVTIVFDFLLRNPQDCIVIFDEPELHLHPELSYRLLRTLRDVGERNQFIFCTHSPEIITAALDQTVVFIAAAAEGVTNQAIVVREDDKYSNVLDLLGQSVGVISLGRRIVLIEGEKSSLDKLTYGSIVGELWPDLVLVPAGGKGTLATFAQAVTGILSKTLWGIDWFMIADGDAAASIADAGRAQAASGGRLQLLARYHLENYFLDEHVLAAVTDYLEVPDNSWLRDPVKIRQELRAIAAQFVSYAVALRISHRLRLAAGNIDAKPRNCHNLEAEELVAAFEARRLEEQARIGAALSQTEIAAAVRAEFARLKGAIEADQDTWSHELPGRPILNAFCSKAGFEVGMLKRLYVKVGRSGARDPFKDIRSIFDNFSRFGQPPAAEPETRAERAGMGSLCKS
jgi:hypothetical protein